MNANIKDTDTFVLGFPEYAHQAQCVAQALHSEFALVDVHRFPDGESMVRLPSVLPERVALVRSLDHPNDKLIELMFATSALRELGVRHVTLVAPYLCYMRQDKAFHAGEAVSQGIIGRFFSQLFDALITVDPHLHRTPRLSDAIPLAGARAVSAAPLMGQFLRDNNDSPLVLGPDAESEQWVRQAAETTKLDFLIAGKTRHGDREVEIDLPRSDLRGREVVILDDVASTGCTIAVAAERAAAAGAARIHAIVTHALFASDAIARLKRVGLDQIWSTDSIPHASNAIQLDQLLAQALRQVWG
jgi:ribose-phosphate pyrophosphokinase